MDAARSFGCGTRNQHGPALRARRTPLFERAPILSADCNPGLLAGNADDPGRPRRARPNPSAIFAVVSTPRGPLGHGPVLLDTHPDRLFSARRSLDVRYGGRLGLAAHNPAGRHAGATCGGHGYRRPARGLAGPRGFGRPSTSAQRAMAFYERRWATPAGALTRGVRIHHNAPSPTRGQPWAASVPR